MGKGIFYSGVSDFVWTQTQLTASKNPNISFIYTSAGSFGFSFSQPMQGLGILWRAFSNTFEKQILQNFTVSYLPTIEWYKFGKKFNIERKVNKILKYIIKKNIKIDLIHAHFTQEAGVIAHELSKKLRCKYIITEHSSPFPINDPLLINEHGLTNYIKAPLDNAEKVIAVSHYQKKVLESFNIKKVVYIPNFISEEIFSVSYEKSKEFQFISVGSLIPQKGMDILINGFSELCLKNKNHIFKLKIVGDGVKRKELELLTENLGIHDKVEFCGSMNSQEIMKKLQESHCFVSASRHESFGIVAIEAMACGLPIVGTKCGGLETIVGHEKVGLLVDVGSSKQLSDAMLKIFTEYSSFSSKEIREYFEDNFSSSVSKSIVNVYKEIIS